MCKYTCTFPQVNNTPPTTLLFDIIQFVSVSLSTFTFFFVFVIFADVTKWKMILPFCSNLLPTCWVNLENCKTILQKKKNKKWKIRSEKKIRVLNIILKSNTNYLGLFCWKIVFRLNFHESFITRLSTAN